MSDEESFVEIDLGCTPTACSGCQFVLEQSEFVTRLVFDAVELHDDGFYHDAGIGQIEFSGTWVTQFEFRSDTMKRVDEIDLDTGFYEVHSSRWRAQRVEAEEHHLEHIAEVTGTPVDKIWNVRHFLVVGSGARFHCLANKFSFRVFQDE